MQYTQAQAQAGQSLQARRVFQGVIHILKNLRNGLTK